MDSFKSLIIFLALLCTKHALLHAYTFLQFILEIILWQLNPCTKTSRNVQPY